MSQPSRMTHDLFQPVRRNLRRVRDVWYESLLPWFRPREVVRGPWSSLAVAAALNERGICLLERFLQGDRLAAYQRALDQLIMDTPRTEEDWLTRSCIRTIDLARYPAFTELALDELITAAVERYYGRPIYLACSEVDRLDPVEPYEDQAFRWHHDARGKYIKAMWLLTDVPETGQRMSYMCGSHRRRHAWTTYRDTRWTDEEARRAGTLFECAAPAGSVIVFDTNGIHRGNRNRGPRRDNLVASYSSGRYRRGCRFDPSDGQALAAWQRQLLERSRKPSHGF